MKAQEIKSIHFNYLETSFREWLDILGYSQTTVYQLPNYIRELFYYLESKGKTELSQLTNKDLKNHYKQLQQRSNKTRGGALSASYLNKHQQGINKFIEYLNQTNKLDISALNVRSEKVDNKEIDYLTEEEVKELFSVTNYSTGTHLEPLDYRDRAMLCIFYGCGLRRNEGYHLDLSDINFDKRILHVRKGKGNKERLVPFNKTISKTLETWVYDYRTHLVKEKTEALFISQKGKRMQGQSMNLRLKLLQLRSEQTSLQEKDISLHTLRHSIATHLLAGGMDIEQISKFLGHSSLESTQIYTHLHSKCHPEGGTTVGSQQYSNIPKYMHHQLSEDE